MCATRFSFFATLFALAACAYHLQLGPSWILIPALLVLAKPTSAPRFLLFVLLQTLAIWGELPAVNTNRILTFFAGATLLAAALPQLASLARGGRLDGGKLLAAAEPLLRLELTIVYLASFWHKLNAGFLDPGGSCATALYGQFRETLQPLPMPAAVAVAPLAIYGTLLIEGALPVLLASSATRKAAVALGVLFHFLLGLAWFYSFSATMMALLFLFVPEDFTRQARRWWESHGPRVLAWGKGLALALAPVLAVAAVLLFDSGLGPAENLEQAKPVIKRAIWLAWLAGGAPLALFLHLLRRSKPQERSFAAAFIGPRPVLLLLPLAVLFNALCPYLGLKTETAFAMYSNLRTEGGRSNHLLLRRPLALAPYQTDLVEVLASSDDTLAALAAAGRPLPLIELRRRVHEASSAGGRRIAVTYVRDGVRREVAAAEEDPVLGEPPGYLEGKLLAFRSILRQDERLCVH